MRTTLLAGVFLLAAAAPAFADDVAGSYDVKFEQVSTNCTSPLLYTHGTLAINVKGDSVTIEIERTPTMYGKPAKGGKVSAKSPLKHTMIEGMDGVFSIAGRITEGMLQLVMVGEYQTNGKALCSQSWNVAGAKADAKAKPAPKK
jgi:hypothetical protein